MKKISLFALGLATLLLAGCSHNTGLCVIGKGFVVGETGISYFNGMTILDASRENSSWKVTIDDKDGITLSEGQVKGVRTIERTIGKQCSGYLVELSKTCPEAVQKYLAK